MQWTSDLLNDNVCALNSAGNAHTNVHFDIHPYADGNTHPKWGNPREP